MDVRRFLCVFAISGWLAPAGINWLEVWLEPKGPVTLKVGEVRPYRVRGLSGMNTKPDLTDNPYLKMKTSDPGVVEIRQRDAVLVARSPGKAELEISFREAKTNVPGMVEAHDRDGTSTRR